MKGVWKLKKMEQEKKKSQTRRTGRIMKKNKVERQNVKGDRN